MKLKLFVVATLIVLQASANALAQQVDASQRSYQQARRVLDDAIAAHGGLEALRAVKDFTLKEKASCTRGIKARLQNLRMRSELRKKHSSSIPSVDLSTTI
jgi:hypothetical protein